MNHPSKRFLSTTLLIFFLGVASQVQATTVNVEVQNHSQTLTMFMARHEVGFADAIKVLPGQSKNIELKFSDSSSTINVNYGYETGQTCQFKASHRVVYTPPVGLMGEWSKSATSVGSGTAHCNAIQAIQRYQPPYDYRVMFYMNN